MCPDDNTIQIGQGNLSYVVNGGFALWHAIPVGWNPAAERHVRGRTAPAADCHAQMGLAAAARLPQWVADMANTQKLGVMFPESTFPQGITTEFPGTCVRRSRASWTAPSNTIMMSENTLTGVSGHFALCTDGPGADQLGVPAAELHVVHRLVVGLRSSGERSIARPASLPRSATWTAIGWSFANKIGTFSNINGGQSLTIEGSYPFSNSGHPGGCNMGFCDGGVRFISNTIDGTVYSKIITPAGSKLPLYLKQMPVEQDAFIN